jgi:hypothetical protein
MKGIIIKVILVIVGLFSVFYIIGEPIDDVLSNSILWCKVLSFMLLLGCIVLWRVLFGSIDRDELA